MSLLVENAVFYINSTPLLEIATKEVVQNPFSLYHGRSILILDRKLVLDLFSVKDSI